MMWRSQRLMYCMVMYNSFFVLVVWERLREQSWAENRIDWSNVSKLLPNKTEPKDKTMHLSKLVKKLAPLK